MIAVTRQESGAQKLEGHDIMALERFDPEVRHMIVFEFGTPKKGFHPNPEPCESNTGTFTV